MTSLLERYERSSRRRKRRRAGQENSATFRADIEGLRAVAVMFVLLWHAGIPWLPGGFVGVDVFFVISGFLMTSILHREQLRDGRVSITGFYARRARRLIPASVVTLVFTAAATALVLPETRWRDIGVDIAAAGGYVVNWVLASRSVDYLSQDAAPSPLQHFWSLSVEEQFYIFWPLLLGAIAWLVTKARSRITPPTLVLLTGIFAASLWWSIHLTGTDPGRAYFVTTTRVWELALGGLVALALPKLAAIPRAAAAAIAWMGVIGIMATGLLLTTSVPFPGSIALIPTISTAMVIAAGPAAGPLGPVRIFDNRVVLWIGGCSYSMYLWHWPVLVIGGYWLTDGLREITVTEGVVLVAVSVLPAWLSLRSVENPIRQADSVVESVRHSLSLAGFGIMISVAAGLVLMTWVPKPADTGYVSQYVAPSGESERIGAELLAPDPWNSPAAVLSDSVASITPNPQDAPGDNPPVYDNGCHLDYGESSPNWCIFGDTTSNVNVAVIGDSHAAQWLPALQSVADKRKWKLWFSTKSACPFLDAPIEYRNQPYQECAEWNRQVLERLTGPEKPDAVVLSYGDYPIPQEELVRGAVARLSPVTALGIPVAIIRDTPKDNLDQSECVAAHRDSLTACATPRDEALARRDQSQPAVAAALPGTRLVDLTDWICPSSQRCPSVIGGVLRMRDNQHLTATYARSLAPALDGALTGFPR